MFDREGPIGSQILYRQRKHLNHIAVYLTDIELQKLDTICKYDNRNRSGMLGHILRMEFRRRQQRGQFDEV